MQALGPGFLFTTWQPVGPHPHDDDNREHIHEHGQNAGDDARHEQLANVLLREDGIDRQHRGRWQHGSQGAASCDDAGCERLRITEAAHLGVSHG